MKTIQLNQNISEKQHVYVRETEREVMIKQMAQNVKNWSICSEGIQFFLLLIPFLLVWNYFKIKSWGGNPTDSHQLKNLQLANFIGTKKTTHPIKSTTLPTNRWLSVTCWVSLVECHLTSEPKQAHEQPWGIKLLDPQIFLPHDNTKNILMNII